MKQCLCTSHCTRNYCDLACPENAEVKFWLKRNDLWPPNITKTSFTKLELARKYVESNLFKTSYMKAKNPMETADIVTYVCICLYGKKTAFTSGVFNLDFAEYIDLTKDSWTSKSKSEKLQFMETWSHTSNQLIVSNIEYMKFSDFESQTLLRLIRERDTDGKTTFIIGSKEEIIGYGPFFTRLQSVIKEATVE